MLADIVITTQAQLEEAWHDLMGPWSFGRHSLWLLVIADDRPVPHLTEIELDADPPGAEDLDGMAQVLDMLAEDLGPDIRVAFLRSRPGIDTITATDRAWASSLYAAARRARVSCEVVHLATRGSVRPIPADVVGIRSASA